MSLVQKAPSTIEKDRDIVFRAQKGNTAWLDTPLVYSALLEPTSLHSIGPTAQIASLANSKFLRAKVHAPAVILASTSKRHASRHAAIAYLGNTRATLGVQAAPRAAQENIRVLQGRQHAWRAVAWI